MAVKLVWESICTVSRVSCTALRTMLCKGAPHMHAPVDSDCSVNVQTFDQLGVRG